MSPTSQPVSPQAAETKRQSPRPRRLSAIHRGAHAAIDSAVEARRDTEHIAVEYEIRRADVQDLFAWCSRRKLRQIEGLLREMDARLIQIERELRGEARPAMRRVA